MEYLTELLDLICELVETNCNLDSKILLEELPSEDGLYAELGEGITENTYFDKSTTKIIPIIFQSCSTDQKRGIEQLCSICNYLQSLRKYPQGNSFSWLTTTVAKEPKKISKDENGMYVYSCVLNCRIYY